MSTKPRPVGYRRRASWILFGVLAFATVSGAYFLAKRNDKDCPGHWHSTFLVFVDGDQVHFNRPIFLRGPDGIKDYDLHADDQVMHFHPQFQRERCVPVSHFLLNLGIRLSDDDITFNEYFGANAGTYHENATHELQVHYQPWNGTWREVTWSWMDGRQLAPGDKLLITYGQLSPGLVESQKELVRDLPDHYLPPDYRQNPHGTVPDEHAPANTTAPTSP